MKKKYIGQEIKILQTQIHRYLSGACADVGMDRLGGTAMWIVGYVASHKQKDVFQKDLEKDIGITRSAASKAVDTLVRDGYIIRETVPSDARLKKLVLTEKARSAMQQMDNHFLRMEEALESGFSPEELETLREYLQRLQQNIRNYVGAEHEKERQKEDW